MLKPIISLLWVMIGAILSICSTSAHVCHSHVHICVITPEARIPPPCWGLLGIGQRLLS